MNKIDESLKEQIRELITNEIKDKLKIDIHSEGFESTGIIIKIEYDGSMLAYEKL